MLYKVMQLPRLKYRGSHYSRFMIVEAKTEKEAKKSLISLNHKGTSCEYCAITAVSLELGKEYYI